MNNWISLFFSLFLWTTLSAKDSLAVLTFTDYMKIVKLEHPIAYQANFKLDKNRIAYLYTLGELPVIF